MTACYLLSILVSATIGMQSQLQLPQDLLEYSERILVRPCCTLYDSVMAAVVVVHLGTALALFTLWRFTRHLFACSSALLLVGLAFEPLPSVMTTFNVVSGIVSALLLGALLAILYVSEHRSVFQAAPMSSNTSLKGDARGDAARAP
ncbi:MAG: hypothetical protein E6H75_02855 [Betaproteobacteria bacterium]|nr:MAG: hypothetical protein E6H75_02855 [Betaproteobacteria bacterium]